MTLLRALVLIVLVTTIAQGFAVLAVTFAHARILHIANALARDALLSAPIAVQQSVAARIAVGASPPTTLAPISTCMQVGASSCALQTTTTVALIALPGAPILQGNVAVSEGRFAIRFQSSVRDTQGRTIAQRSSTALLRTLAQPPFASYEGQGENGGIPPSATSQGTLVDVLYQNASSGARMPGNVWSAPSSPAPTSTPAWAL